MVLGRLGGVGLVSMSSCGGAPSMVLSNVDMRFWPRSKVMTCLVISIGARAMSLRH